MNFEHPLERLERVLETGSTVAFLVGEAHSTKYSRSTYIPSQNVHSQSMYMLS